MPPTSPPVAEVDTVWVFGDQLNRAIGALGRADPAETRVLMVESRAKVTGRRWHRQRAHLLVAAMRRFSRELVDAGFAVDHREADSFAAGLDAHRKAHRPDEVVATEPNSWDGRELVARLGVTTVASDQFLCHPDDFAAWAADAGRLRMENFYRWQRRRLGVLIDGDEPAGGRWNFDPENREPPPAGGGIWPDPVTSRLGEADRSVLEHLDAIGVPTWGQGPHGFWPTSRRAALARLRHFVDNVLSSFGPHQDAMTSTNWHLAHALLSPALNIGLLLPGEVVEAAEDAYRTGRVPIASAEGFVRQVIGWREYVWGLYWLWMPEYRDTNELGADRPLPPVLAGDAGTDMACVANTLAGLEANAWTHHIQRLMVLGNLALLAGVRPAEMVDWMWERYVDGAEWVMLPNVIGMATHADGGRMATKPYAAGGAYINRMSDYCGDCRYDPGSRTGADACPFTTLYWDFLARHRERFSDNHRMKVILGNLDRLGDLDEVRERASEVLVRLDRGEL